MILLNDLHLDANRSAGATPASAKALKEYSLNSFTNFLETVDEDVIIVGDLMDTWQIGLSTVLAVYQAFNKWLEKGHKLAVQAANHDLSTDSSKYGSLQFLMALFADHSNVQFVIEKGAWVAEGMYCIPQMQNQDSYNLELSRVPECEVLFLHCNVDNFHAISSDHSLNITREQIDKLPAKLVYSGHEHHARKVGKVFVGGVQWPTSISDVLDKKDKFAYRLTGTTLEPIKTWSKDDYAELNWKNPQPTTARFIRFVGNATPDEAAQVADTIARYRRASEAFIVSNAVKIGEDSEMDEFSVQSLEQARAFDVMGALKGFLTEEEYKILEKLND